jgi:hypothetical protein
MALINLGCSLCALCEHVINRGDDCIGMCDWLPWRFSRYADAPMHRACFNAWPLAGDLISAFNEVSRSWPEHPCQMLEDGSLVAVDAEDLRPMDSGRPGPAADISGSPNGQGDLLSLLDRPDVREATPANSVAS